MVKKLQRPLSQFDPRATSAVLALVVLWVFGIVTTPSAQGQTTFSVLYNFTGSSGAYPYAGVVRDSAGNLYGTTASGGSKGEGVVFKVSTGGKETVLYNFANGSDGGVPYAQLIRDQSGNLYGTTASGGKSGFGAVFKVANNGKETVLHSFGGGTTDGCIPYGGLVLDSSGNLYGTTSSCGASNLGTVFKVNKSGTETVLHSFAGGSPDGASPYYTSLLRDKSGNLYGVTQQGGSANMGVVYKLDSSGTLIVLHSFAGGTADGCSVFGTPAMDKNGTLYGSTEGCGASGYGIVWKLANSGTETVLHNFAGGSSDGASPVAGVIVDTSGDLYGVTQAGGKTGYGLVYELSKGKLTILHSFAKSDGKDPVGGLSRDSKGNLYGTALYRGKNGYGTVWSLK